MFRKRSTDFPQLLLEYNIKPKEQQGKQWKASMCVRILFLSFEELVIRQSHNIKGNLGEKKNTDLYLVNKSKITEQSCHIYHHGIICLKEFLVVSRDKFR